MSDQLVTIEIESISHRLRVRRMQLSERLHAPWRLTLVLRSEEDDGAAIQLDAPALITKSAKVTLGYGDGTSRTFEGVIDSVDGQWQHVTIVVVPTLALLADVVDQRVFVEKDSLEIVTAVLAEHAIKVEARVTRTLPKRPQCVQPFESDLAFVSRLIAEEGAVLFAPLDRKDVVIVTDHKEGFEPLPSCEDLVVVEDSGFHDAHVVFDVRLTHAHTFGKVTLRDYNFVVPGVDLTQSTGDGPLECYEYPGNYPDAALGRTLADIRLAQLRSEQQVLRGKTTSRRLSPGYVIELDAAARPSINAKWIVVETTHEAVDHGGRVETGTRRYVCSFLAVPADRGYRPTPARTRMPGIQTCTICGPSGVEIHTEQHSRIKGQLRWDRVGKLDDKSSTWMRVVHPPTSGGFLLPRTTWESLVAFRGGSADQPFILGRFYNGVVRPPQALPAAKVSSSFGTMTTPGGGSANGITMNDTAGNEGMSFVASKDFNEKTENHKLTAVTADDTHTIGAGRKLMVGQVLGLGVDGAQTYTIGASRTVNCDANKAINAASETIAIGGLRMFNVGGDYLTSCSTLTRLVGAARAEIAIEHITRKVTGAATILVGGAWKVLANPSAGINVLGANTELVAGAKSIKTANFTMNVRGVLNETFASRKVKTGGDRGEKYGAAGSYAIGATAKIKGSDIVIKASGSITIKASGITIKMTPSEITVDGKFSGKVDAVDNGNEKYG